MDPEIRPETFDPHDRLSASSFWLPCREAIDAGQEEIAVGSARLHGRDTALGQAVLATLEATAS